MKSIFKEDLLRQIPFGTIVPDEDVALPEEMERDVVNRLKDLLRPFVKQRKKDAIYRYQGSIFSSFSILPKMFQAETMQT